MDLDATPKNVYYLYNWDDVSCRVMPNFIYRSPLGPCLAGVAVSLLCFFIIGLAAWVSAVIDGPLAVALCSASTLAGIAVYELLDKRRYRSALYYCPDDELCTFFRRYDGYIGEFNENARKLFGFLPETRPGEIHVDHIRIPGSVTSKHIKDALANGHGGANGILQFQTCTKWGNKPKRIIAHTTGIFRETGIEVLIKDCSQTYIDPLTNCLRKNEFIDFWTKSFAEEEVVYTAIFVDLDDFKHVNDKYGHHAGDQILSQMGERLNEMFTLSDLIVRYGGDEFLILQRHKDPETINTNQVAEIEKNIVGFYYIPSGEGDHAGIKEIYQAASVASSPPMLVKSVDDLFKAIHAADKAMYAKKRKVNTRTIRRVRVIDG